MNRSEEKLVRALSRRRRREAEGLFLGEGVRVVEELMEAGIVLRLALASPSLGDTPRGVALARRLEGATTLRAVSESQLAEIAPTRTPQGVLVVAETPTADLATLTVGPGTTVLILDGVQDPGNVGTLARSAAAFGCPVLACLPGTVDPWNPKAVRAAAGALFRMSVVEEPPDRLWSWLEDGGFTILGADAGGVPVGERRRQGPTALVVGNEGAGLGGETRSRCHELVAVPMSGGTESLNVAVAAGILLYEITGGRG
jgi:RNA methyltransferase, TrmH family